jgi:NAD(P)-dependent dehydrogenase (short-subunit alcohol dehydrogenase family)
VRNLQGKVAFITGGVSGIGLGVAKALAAAGVSIAMSYRRESQLREALRQLDSAQGSAILPVQLDVTDRSAVARAAAEVDARFGKVHIICNSAGVSLLGRADEASMEDWDWVMGVNVGGVINVLSHFLPRLKSNGEGGHVVNVGSMACFIAEPDTGVYATSKFALRGLTESLRESLLSHGIGLSLVCPGITQSNLHECSFRRPAHLARTAFPLESATLRKMQRIHAAGMDADEVGRQVVRAILDDEFYVFTHPEYKESLRELLEEPLKAFRDEPRDARRELLEKVRRVRRRQRLGL